MLKSTLFDTKLLTMTFNGGINFKINHKTTLIFCIFE